MPGHSTTPFILTVCSGSCVTTGKPFSALYHLKPSINVAYSNSTPSFHVCTQPPSPAHTQHLYKAQGRPPNVSIILHLSSMQEALQRESLLTCNRKLPLSCASAAGGCEGFVRSGTLCISIYYTCLSASHFCSTQLRMNAHDPLHSEDHLHVTHHQPKT